MLFPIWIIKTSSPFPVAADLLFPGVVIRGGGAGESQHGALLAKGRLIGIQFDTLFTDGLYQEISAHAIRMAEKLKKALMEKGYTMYLDSPTNQQFVILENRQMERLAKKVAFSFWETLDEDHTAVRFVTSWATDPQNLEALWEILAQEAGQKA